MIAHVLQGWTTLRGPLNADISIRQSELEWLTLEGFRDVTAWLHVSQATGAGAVLRLLLETSPTLDDVNFRTLSDTSVGTAGLYVAIARGNQLVASSVALETFLRWRLVGSAPAAWSITFRIILCLNPTVPTFRMVRGDEVFTNPALGAG